MSANARHSSESNDHGTPPEIVEAARHTMGRIDLDPASSPVFNRVVRAARIYTIEQNGLAQAWKGTVLCNPPGGINEADRSSVQASWWHEVARRWRKREIRQAVFVAFSIELFQTAQSKEGSLYPTDFPFCIPAARPKYQKQVAREDRPGVDLVPGGSPTHAGAVIYLPPSGSIDDETRAAWIARFLKAYQPIGRCSNYGALP